MDLRTFSVSLSLVAIALLFIIGAIAAIAPAVLSRAFGLPIERGDPAIAYVRGLGVRDLALAIAMALFVGEYESGYLTVSFLCAITCVVALVDFASVLIARKGRFCAALFAHAGGAVLFALCAVLLYNAYPPCC